MKKKPAHRRRPELGEIVTRLGCLRDFASLDTRGADLHPARATLRQLNADRL